ncbi:MAG TPA: hypothetical protein VG889_17405 [Rhizomicrobium sp.]|nr:hypothetical protein [Rhizomicrobium sp.]
MNAVADKPKGAAVASVTDPRKYNALVAAAQLRDIRLVESGFALTPDGLEKRHEFKLSQTCEIEKAHVDVGRGLLVVFVAATASAAFANAEMQAAMEVMSAKCRYLIVYHVSGDPAPEAVDAFARRVARFAAYPYFRAHFAELASQAGLMLPPLPVIKERRLIPEVGQSPAAPATTPVGKSRRAAKLKRPVAKPSSKK